MRSARPKLREDLQKAENENAQREEQQESSSRIRSKAILQMRSPLLIGYRSRMPRHEVCVGGS